MATPSPNPFNPRTTLSFTLPTTQHVRLDIHDLRGRLVTTLVRGTLPVGRHEVVWNGRDSSARDVPSSVVPSQSSSSSLQVSSAPGFTPTSSSSQSVPCSTVNAASSSGRKLRPWMLRWP